MYLHYPFIRHKVIVNFFEGPLHYPFFAFLKLMLSTRLFAIMVFLTSLFVVLGMFILSANSSNCDQSFLRTCTYFWIFKKKNFL